MEELARKCGVSVQALRKWCSRNGVSKSGGRYVLTDDVRKRAFEHYTNKGNVSESVSRESSDRNVEMKVLLKQLEIKDAQIAEKDRQIAALTDTVSNLTETNAKLLDTNRALSAATAISTAAEKRDAILVDRHDPKPDAETSLWKRLRGVFGRR